MEDGSEWEDSRSDILGDIKGVGSMFVPSHIIFTACQFVPIRLEARFVVQPLRTSLEAGTKEIWSLFQPHNYPI